MTRVMTAAMHNATGSPPNGFTPEQKEYLEGFLAALPVAPFVGTTATGVGTAVGEKPPPQLTTRRGMTARALKKISRRPPCGDIFLRIRAGPTVIKLPNLAFGGF